MRDMKTIDMVVAGDKIAAADGYEWTVAEIVRRTSKTTTLRLTSMSAGLSFPASGVEQTFRNASRVRTA